MPGILFLTVLAAAISLFAVLAKSKLLPGSYLWPVGLLLLLLVGIVYILMGQRNKGWGIGLAIFLAILLFVGCGYISKATKTLNSITNTTVVESEICIYVLNEDSAQTLQDAQNYTFGYVSTIATEDTQMAIADMNEQLGISLQTVGTDNLVSLADALLSGDVQAALLPSSYMDLFEDMEGYEEFPDKIRVLESRVVTVVVTSAPSILDDTEQSSRKSRNDSEIPEFFTVFISGNDNYGALAARSRSDVNILAAINTETREVALISIPRDYYVTLSNVGQLDKLTHSGIFGVDVSKETVGNLFEVDVDYYFRVNFGGFVDIVDALGGVSVQSDYSFYAGGYSFSEGENYLYGAQALAFCRERHSFSSGDRQRGKNQVAVIKGVINKVTTPSMLLNFNNVMSAVEGSFETSVPYDLITALVQDQLSDRRDWTIESYSVTGSDSNRYCYALGMNAYVMTPDMDTVNEAIALIQDIKNG